MVRRAAAVDIPRLLELLVQVDMVHHNGRPDIFKGPTTKYSDQQLRELITDDSSPIFVCVDENDKVLGHAFCQHKQVTDDRVLTDIRTLYIDDICVDETCRGAGVGRQLYEHVLKYASDNEYYNVTLNVWSCNPGALEFYKKMGFETQKIGMEIVL